MSAIGLLVLQVMLLGSTGAQFGGGSNGGGGGPSTFGYDGSSACSKPYSRHGRARFEKLPCDFRRQNWCTVAGNAYPWYVTSVCTEIFVLTNSWHAVRRFVQENHGLMRRMYGDERQINILKAELEKNDIELEYEDQRYQRYPEDARRFQYETDDYEFVDFDNRQENNENRLRFRDDEDAHRARSFTSGSIDESLTTERTRKYTKSSEDDYTRPRTRPTESSATSSTTTTTTTKIATDLTSSASTIGVSEIPKTTTEFSTTSKKSSNPEDLSLLISSPAVSSIFTESPVEKIAILQTGAVESISKENSTNSEKIDSTAAATLADIARIKNSSINEIPGQLERVKDHSFDPNEPIAPESIVEDTSLELDNTNERFSTPSNVDRIGEADDLKDDNHNDESFAASENLPQQESKPKPEDKPIEINKPETSSHESQLFQDVAAKDQPVLKLRGVNACPVKMEVVAPFWANNTRGEVLALLNLYPFEQYVHWEKCTHENKQMYCRDGCRCEQEYRLHRLLAYDPNNECRGIFSDWFKFPSCCVCRCYDLPVEFRVTSRSPRVSKQKLRLRTPSHRRGSL